MRILIANRGLCGYKFTQSAFACDVTLVGIITQDDIASKYKYLGVIEE